MDGPGDADSDDEDTTTHTCCAHIFDWSANENPDDVREVRRFHDEYTASVLAMVDRFGGVSIVDELDGPRAHRLENVLALAVEVRMRFDELLIWLETKPGDPDGWYTVQSYNRKSPKGIPPRVHFGTPDAAEYPLPDPRYPAVHAACLDEIQRDVDDTRVLCDDGSTDSALYSAFVRHGIL